ncbi:MAG: HNH endonuclease signature motif containing protein [Micrococcaceae bacterium]
MARDGGCARPGCTAPASWSQGHHIRHWAEGGPTDLDNLVLLCPGCHRLVHQGKYTIEMVNAVPWFTPAFWLCPDPTPQRNRCHRPWDDDVAPPPDPAQETRHDPADAPPTHVV